MMSPTLEGSKRTRPSAEDARTHLIGDADEDCLITKFTEFYLFLARRPWPVGIGGGLVVLAYMPLLLLVYPPAAFMVWSITLNIHRRNCVIAYGIAQKVTLRDANPPMVEVATVINDVAAQSDVDSELSVVIDQCGTMIVPPNYEDWIAHIGTVVDRYPDVEVTLPVPRPDPPSGGIRRLLPPERRSGVSEQSVLATGEPASVDGVASNPSSHSSMPPLNDEVVSKIYVVVVLDENGQIRPHPIIIGPDRPPNVAVDLSANDTITATSVSSSLMSDPPVMTQAGDDEILTVPNHSMVTKLPPKDDLVGKCGGEVMSDVWNKVPTRKAVRSAKLPHVPSIVNVAPATESAAVEQAQKPSPGNNLIGAKASPNLATTVASPSSQRVTADWTIKTKLTAATAVRQYTNRKMRTNKKKMEQRKRKDHNDANYYAPLVGAWNNTPDLTSQSSCGVAYSEGSIAWEEGEGDTWETTALADLPSIGAVADDEEVDQTLVERMKHDARCVTVVLDGYEISNKEWDFVDSTRDVYKQPLLSDDPHLTFSEKCTLRKNRKPIHRRSSKQAVAEHWEEFLSFLGMPSQTVYYKYAQHFKNKDAMKRKVPTIENWYNYYKAGGIDQVETYAIKNWCPHKWTVDKRDVDRRVQYQKNNKFID